MNDTSGISVKPLLASTLLCVIATLLLLIGAALTLARVFDWPIDYFLQSLVAFVGLLLALGPLLPQHRPLTRFGAANAVTLLRAGIAALFAGLIGRPILVPAEAWGLAALAIVALILDGMDGWLARRHGMQSPFGARFDMEVDACFILILAVLVWQSGKAGAWVMLSGAMRYGFVVLGYGLPWLNRPLPPRRRRQTVCVIQTVVLALCLTPPLVPPFSTVLAVAALGLLALSFAVDVAWLWRQHRLSPGNAPQNPRF